METPLNKNKTKKTLKEKAFRWLAFFAAIFLFFIFSALIATLVFELTSRGKIYPGVIIGQINFGDKTQSEALKILEAKRDKIEIEGLVFEAQSDVGGIGKTVAVPAVALATDPDLAKRIFYIDIDKTLSQAYRHGRDRFWLQNLTDQVRTVVFGKIIPVVYEINSKELTDILKASFSKLEDPASDATLVFDDNGEALVLKEKPGYAFDYNQAILDAFKNLALLRDDSIKISIIEQKPAIFANETAQALELAKEVANTTTPTLIYEDKKWQISLNEIKSRLEFTRLENRKIGLQFNRASTTEYLTEIAKSIDIEPQDAKILIEGERAVEFQISRDGKKLNLDKSYEMLNSQYLNERVNNIYLVVEVNPAKVKTAEANGLGIKELIGRGISNFSGSSKNRRHNIAIGAAKLNGILIEPGKEFSLVAALGEISANTGYLPELVIKGDRTIPEYGGGLCQIGTTAFRVALRSGLPITMRRNHSYRVVYYEPAGMDATIYDPYPDMKFINDTGSYILFTTKIEGNDLIFEFYGTKDERKIEITPDPPRIYNIMRPGAPREIETDELKPGEKKLVEHAYNGADTTFDYIVTYSNGEIKKETFNSHYVAWPEVWLIGRQPSTSTEEVLDAVAE